MFRLSLRVAPGSRGSLIGGVGFRPFTTPHNERTFDSMPNEHLGQWFRHYTDAHRTRKLRSLPENTQLFYFWLMELRKEGHYPAPAADIEWLLHVELERVERDLMALRGAGLVDPDGEIHNWPCRQFKSDGQSSTDRVKKHRKMKQSPDVSCNNDETFHETPTEQNRTEQSRTEQEVRRAPAREATSTDKESLSVQTRGARTDLAVCTDLDLVKPTPDQIAHLESLAVTASVTVDEALAQRGYGSLTKMTAGVLIDDLRKRRDGNRSAPVTFTQQKVANTQKAVAAVMRRLEDGDAE